MKSEKIHFDRRNGYEIMKEWEINFTPISSEKIFDDDKIRIQFEKWEYYFLTAYLKDSDGKLHEVLRIQAPDRHYISFDKTNQKVKNFIKSVVNSWLEEEKEEEMERRLLKEKEEKEKEIFLQSLINSF